MTNQLSQLDMYKTEYSQIAIPAELDSVIEIGIEQGKKLKRSQERKLWARNTAAGILISMTLLTTAINVSPSFAEAFSNIPVLGNLVKVLKFVDGKATGGVITDGTDISGMEILQNEGTESFIIHFSQSEQAQDNAAAYEVKQFHNPDMLQIDVGGARMISAVDDFAMIMSLESVADVYTLMTLDDSLIRFNVVFNQPVSIEMEELKEPAGLKVTTSPQEESSGQVVYTVRSSSYSFGESFGHIEESLFWELDEAMRGTYRILKDADNNHFIEFGQFASREEALTLLKALQKSLSIHVTLEERAPFEIPEVISDSSN